jgi:hypothetical protein
MVSNYIIFYGTFATHIKPKLANDDCDLSQEVDLGLPSLLKGGYDSVRRARSIFGNPLNGAKEMDTNISRARNLLQRQCVLWLDSAFV